MHVIMYMTVEERVAPVDKPGECEARPPKPNPPHLDNFTPPTPKPRAEARRSEARPLWRIRPRNVKPALCGGFARAEGEAEAPRRSRSPRPIASCTSIFDAIARSTFLSFFFAPRRSPRSQFNI